MITHSLLATFHMAHASGGVIQACVGLNWAARPQTSVTFSRTSHRTLTSFIKRACLGTGTKDSNSDTGNEGPCAEAQPVNTMSAAVEAKIARQRNALPIKILTEFIFYTPATIKNINK
jgi:hypothetical protein